MLIPYDPYSTHYLWFLKWREHVRTAKQCKENYGYCRAAVLAQAQYVMYLAFHIIDLKKEGIIKDDGN